MNTVMKKDLPVILLAAASVLFLSLAVFFAVLFFRGNATVPHDGQPVEDDPELDRLRAELTSTEAELARKEAELLEAYEERDRLTAEIERIENGDDSRDKELTELRLRLSSVNETISARDADIRRLKNQLNAWQSLLSIDVGEQIKNITELYELLGYKAPERNVKVEKKDDNGKTVTVTEKQYPNLSFYYQDLESGYTIKYNENESRYSASLVKAPFIYAVLKEISEFESDKLNFDENGNRLYDDKGNPLFTGKHPNFDEKGNIIYLEGEEKYDLSRKWVYDSETMSAVGSGIIQDEEDGFTLTYRELIEYTILYSDNVAFSQLIKTFTLQPLYDEAYALGVTGMREGYASFCAADCALFLSAMYDFFEDDEEYGPFLCDLMKRSNYNVLFKYGVDPLELAHKYGWDKESYHDMAIVFDEHPYILVLMSDLDEGRQEDISFFNKVAAITNKIHQGFYGYFDKLTVKPET